MITVNLYQPGKINCTIQFPAAWDDLFPEEVMEISRQQLQDGNDQYKARAAILKFIIKFRAKITKQKFNPDWFNLIDAEQAVVNGYPLLDFIYDGNTLTKPPENCITHRTSYFLHRTSYYGPGTTFENLTVGEFEDAEQLYGGFFNDPDGKPLAHLAAILWRPKTKRFGSSFGGTRLPYISYNYKSASYKTYNAEKRIPDFLKLEPCRLYAIYTWYTGCRNQLPLLFPKIHEHHGDKSGKPDIMAFTNCIHAGAGPKNGTRQQIRLLKLSEFMYDMEQEAKKIIEKPQPHE